MITKETEESVLALFRLPLYCCDGIIFDANKTQVLDVRGWGYLSHFDEAVKIQDSMVEMIVKAFNEKYYNEYTHSVAQPEETILKQAYKPRKHP